ncbi:MAG: aminopeptidase 1 [Acidobacteriota bacterium]
MVTRKRLNQTSIALLLSLGVAGYTASSSAAPAAQAGSAEGASSQEEQSLSSWLGLSASDRREIEEYARQYKSFLGRARTELSFVTEAVRLVRARGFRELRDDSRLTPGARFYDVNRDRAMALIVIGQEDFERGFRIVGAHIDSPRLELKGRPLYEKEGFALFQTSFHGGLKNYEWTNIPLALMGRVDKKDGTTVWISIGNEPENPVFIIADLAPHVDVDFRKRTNREVILAEEMDPLVGHIPGKDKSVSKMVEEFLKTTYGIELEDLISAELALVPALPPRDVGFDRALMAIYGQDDRLSAYAALQAIMAVEDPRFTDVAYFVDNEEVGNVNNTGARSTYLVDLMGRLMYTRLGEKYRNPQLRRALRNTRVISADVNPGIHPIWPEAFERGNAPRLGYGVNLKLYGQGFNANSEYIAWVRAILDEEGVPWQTTMYKVGRGGGGTIGNELSKDNMEVIDLGVPVLSIHTPYSISSKIDVHSLFRALRAFYANRSTVGPSARD